MRIFLSEAAYQRSIKSKVDGLTQTQIGERIKLYSENPAFLRQALAAYDGVNPKHVSPDARRISWMGRAIRKFGDMLVAENTRPHPIPGTIGEVLANLRGEEAAEIGATG